MLPFIRPRTPATYVLLAVALLFLLLVLPARLVELLWFDNLGYEQVFWRRLGLQSALFLSGFLLAAAYLGANFIYIYRHYSVLRWKVGMDVQREQAPEIELTPERLRAMAIVVSVLIGLFFAGHFAGLYDLFLRFIGDVATGIDDPIFGNDLSFYLLRLPFIEAIQSVLMTISMLTVALSIGTYVWMGSVMVDKGRLIAPRPVIRQLSVNIAVFVAAWGLGYFLSRYGLLYRSGGTVHGIGYIEQNVVIPAYWVMFVASLLLAALLIFNLQRARAKLLGVGLVGYFLLMVIGLGVLPAAVQRFGVEPNELELERPYLEHNIRYTRLAYGIDDVEERSYPAELTLSYSDVLANEATVNNIRLWDPRLLIQTFRQIQEIRTYYQFYNVDIDRYEIDGEVRQVMLSARELAQRLPERADTWINRHMQYTHGYGLTMNAVAEIGAEGTPELLVRDLPPVSEFDLPLGRPAIYYGEAIPTYRIVNTEVQELSYPSGDENVYTHYDGTGGVQLSSMWRRLLFAFYHGDTNLILSDLIHPESRIQFWNRIQERVRKIAPFLMLDDDPYLVITDDGPIWIQDAYTTSRTFPYSESEPRTGLNYIRNSVKVVIDAYDGSVIFYVMDEEDPVLGAYREFFPDLFRSSDEMPQYVRQHLRYPQDLFDLQVSRFTRYHMTIPQVFYNNEDLWTRPREQYGGSSIPMEPYYVLTKLPGDVEMDYLLMTPLTPESRDNMIAWMAARSDPEDYGRLIVYKLPKERLIYGPIQVESRIDQDTEISEQLALWDQRGSRVVRGNLMVIPIEQSFIYVEPVFLIAEGTQIPQLRRVIVSYGERVAMERTLDEALAAVFEEDLQRLIAREEMNLEDLPATALSGQAQQELRRARQTLDRAMSALQEGDFSSFGERIEDLRQILEESEQEATPDAVAPEEAPVGQ